MTLVVLLLVALVAIALTRFWRLPASPPAGGLRAAPVVWLRLALRSAALALALLYGAAKAWLASAGLAPSARWWLWGAAALLLLPLLLNTVAGLWFLLRLGPTRLDGWLTVLGHTGRLREVGLSRIALVEEGGRVVLLPYLPLAWQPLAIAPPAATAASRILLERESWSEEQRRFLLQAAVLSPYRDVASPVSVSVSGRVASVGISLVRPEAIGLLERALERALDERERTRLETPAPARESPTGAVS
jgi:hypothetical protein